MISITDQKLAAIARLEAELGPHDLAVAEALEEFALWYGDNRLYSGAVPHLRRSLEIREALLGANLLVADALDRWARCAERKDKAESTELFERSLKVRQNVLGEASPDLLPVLEALVGHYLQRFRIADAVACRMRGLAIAEAMHGSVSNEVATRLLHIGQNRLAMGDPAGAEPAFRRALAIRAEIATPDDADLAATVDGLIRALAALDRPEEIGALLQRSLKAKAVVFAKDPARLVEALMGTAEAVAAYGQVQDLTALLPEGPVPVWPENVRLLLHLGRQLIRKDRSAEADDVVGLAVATLQRIFALSRESRAAPLETILPADHGLLLRMCEAPDLGNEDLVEALGWLAANPEGIPGRRPPSILG